MSKVRARKLREPGGSMSYANGRIIHDADSHVMETGDWLAAFADSEYAAQVRSLYGNKPNRIDKIVDEAKKRRSDAEAASKAAQNPIAGPKGWIAYGAFDADERNAVVEGFGFRSQL